MLRYDFIIIMHELFIFSKTYEFAPTSMLYHVLWFDMHF
jgi:hypothetical protein